jgi:short-subunit dehydrogenase
VASDGVKVVTVCPGLMRTGSPRNAIFRGKHRSEYAWFSISDALPGLSISAEKAARRILAACRRGDAEVLFPLSAKAATVVNAVAPGLTAGILATVDRLLPDARGGSGGGPTRLGDRAARKYNQMSLPEGATP